MNVRNRTPELDRIFAKLDGVSESGENQWMARCPSHDDRTPSLSIGLREDHILINCHAGCHISTVLRDLGLDERDLFIGGRDQSDDFAAIYPYDDEKGHLLFQACRKDPKGFVQRSPDGDGDWIYRLDGVRRVLYCLPELIDAPRDALVFIVEGEKDVESLRSLGFTATCNPGGAGKWRESYNPFLKSRQVVVIPDNDEPGIRHSEQAANSLKDVAASIRVIELPGVGPKGDVSDWLNEGHSKEELLTLVDRAEDWHPAIQTNPREVSGTHFHLTDAGNAKRLVALHGENLRYCHAWKTWLYWDGKRWCRDESGKIMRLAKETVQSIYLEASVAVEISERTAIANHARKSESESRLRSMISLARSEPGLSVRPVEMDRNTWLLNVSNGTIDLKTGKLKTHSREDLCTKLAPVHFDESAVCPLWQEFLGTITRDEALASFLQRAVGYSLTGETNERVLFFLHGAGANGKTTFLEAIRCMLGDYAQNTPFESLLIGRSGGARNDLARLAGSRFVTAQEVSRGRKLDESLVKQLTGRDTISVRFLYSEYFEFIPQFKLFLTANHKPIIDGTDNAIWSRIHLIPLDVTIPLAKQDKQLPGKLITELPGILAWALKGCLEWQAQGLDAPSKVTVATESYRNEMDIIGEFITARCSLSESATTLSRDLFGEYESWCRSEGIQSESQKKLGMCLSERGLKRKRVGKERRCAWEGISLLKASVETP